MKNKTTEKKEQTETTTVDTEKGGWKGNIVYVSGLLLGGYAFFCVIKTSLEAIDWCYDKAKTSYENSIVDIARPVFQEEVRHSRELYLARLNQYSDEINKRLLRVDNKLADLQWLMKKKEAEERVELETNSSPFFYYYNWPTNLSTNRIFIITNNGPAYITWPDDWK